MHSLQTGSIQWINKSGYYIQKSTLQKSIMANVLCFFCVLQRVVKLIYKKKILGIIFTVFLLFAALPNVMAANYYEIENVYFSDLSGNVLENPSHSCMINAEIREKIKRTSDDNAVIAVYAKDGTMLNCN